MPTVVTPPDIRRFAVGFESIFINLNRTAGTLNATNYPPYNIVRYSETAYTVEIAVAGFAEDELDIEVVNHELVVHGASKLVDDPNVEYIHRGIATRNFVRSFALAENVEVKGAVVKNGILTVMLEHIIPETAKPRKVAISFQP
jgi:molecular chaperone IbpA